MIGLFVSFLQMEEGGNWSNPTICLTTSQNQHLQGLQMDARDVA